MSEVVLSAEKRSESGKSYARKLRREGRVPGIVYGAGDDTASISLNKIELARMLRHEHAIVNVKVDGNDQPAVVKSVDVHPLSGDVIHIDFLRVVAGQEMTVTIPINIVGTAVGTKIGGVLAVLKHDVEISVLPKYMPDHIDIDVSELEIGDVIRIKEITLENMSFVEDAEELICQVNQPRKEEEPEELEEGLGEEEEESAEPEVITARSDEDSEEESE